MIRLGILGSTRGTNLTALINAIEKNELAASIEIVISNKKTAPILDRAREAELQAIFLDPTNLTREEYDSQISRLLKQYGVELIVLIGYMRILSQEFVEAWSNKIINVHPSLLPAFAGKMDLDVHRAVLAANQTTSGSTVHYVTTEVDAGPIIIQKECPVLPSDTPESLKQRVQTLEAKSLIEAINLIEKE